MTYITINSIGIWYSLQWCEYTVTYVYAFSISYICVQPLHDEGKRSINNGEIKWTGSGRIAQNRHIYREQNMMKLRPTTGHYGCTKIMMTTTTNPSALL